MTLGKKPSGRNKNETNISNKFDTLIALNDLN